MSRLEEPEAWIAASAGRAAGCAVSGWRRTPGGYTPASRWVAQLAVGGTVFVKAATTPDTAKWLRREYAFYRQVEAPFLPRCLGWDDAGPWPVLLLEDLSAAIWPPPWTRDRIGRVLETLRSVAATPPPPGLPPLAGRAPKMFFGWSEVAAEPGPFLSLHLCSAAWLERSLPALLASQRVDLFDGRDLVHTDTRSDNLCFAGERTLFVDWNLACVGNGLMDIAFWLPSLQFEGGPAPETVSREAGAFAGMVAGYFAARAGLPLIPDAPFVRRVQRKQLSTALPWAVRTLGLEPLDESPAFEAQP